MIFCKRRGIFHAENLSLFLRAGLVDTIVAMEKKIQKTPAVSLRFRDGTVVETLYDREKEKLSFAIYLNGQLEIADEFKGSTGIRYVPYAGARTLVKNGIVSFPTRPEIYEKQRNTGLRRFENLLTGLLIYIPVFLDVAVYYVILTWVYDDFQEIPYLRLKGEFGSGKTRFLKVRWGALLQSYICIGCDQYRAYISHAG